MTAETRNARGLVEYEYEVWRGDAWQAGGSTTDYAAAQSEADHYAMIFGQDGPVEVRIYEKRLLSVATPPTAAEGVQADEVEQRAWELLEAECGKPLPLDIPVCAALSAARAALSQQPAPSAPVGVEKVKKALERLDRTIEACAKLTQLLGDGQPHSDLISTAGGQAALAKEAIQRALAQQTAAVVVDDTRGRAK